MMTELSQYLIPAILAILLVVIVVLATTIKFSRKPKRKRPQNKNWVPRELKWQERVINFDLFLVVLMFVFSASFTSAEKLENKILLNITEINPQIFPIVLIVLSYIANIAFGITFERWRIRMNQKNENRETALQIATQTAKELQRIAQEVRDFETNMRLSGQEDHLEQTSKFFYERIENERSAIIKNAAAKILELFPWDAERVDIAKAFTYDIMRDREAIDSLLESRNRSNQNGTSDLSDLNEDDE
jgi:hypothetical protein